MQTYVTTRVPEVGDIKTPWPYSKIGAKAKVEILEVILPIRAVKILIHNHWGGLPVFDTIPFVLEDPSEAFRNHRRKRAMMEHDKIDAEIMIRRTNR